MKPGTRTTVAVAITLLLAAGCTGNSEDSSVEANTSAYNGAGLPAEVHGPTVIATGDIVCPPGSTTTRDECQQAATASLAKTYEPRHVFALGDLQYQSGTSNDFQYSYRRSWGTFKQITRPIPGNHEYRTDGAFGYYAYFADQQPGEPGYYAFNVNGWRIYALNSNCDQIDCDRETRWLRDDLVAHPRKCSMILTHHPRYSSGSEHGSDPTMNRFWRPALRHHVDVALAGHEHSYERFVPMKADGTPATNGIQSFVSGLGGKSLYPFGARQPGSRARYDGSAGVLAMKLGKHRYAWQFMAITGKVIDSGIRSCR